jgi:hypothetical protein
MNSGRAEAIRVAAAGAHNLHQNTGEVIALGIGRQMSLIRSAKSGLPKPARSEREGFVEMSLGVTLRGVSEMDGEGHSTSSELFITASESFSNPSLIVIPSDSKAP